MVEPPALIVVGDAVNDVMFGAPTQPDDVPGTTIFTVTCPPKNVPFGARICQLPVDVPGVDGVVIGTLRSMVVPDAVAGTFTTAFVVIAVPLTKTN